LAKRRSTLASPPKISNGLGYISLWREEQAKARKNARREEEAKARKNARREEQAKADKKATKKDESEKKGNKWCNKCINKYIILVRLVFPHTIVMATGGSGMAAGGSRMAAGDSGMAAGSSESSGMAATVVSDWPQEVLEWQL